MPLSDKNRHLTTREYRQLEEVHVRLEKTLVRHGRRLTRLAIQRDAAGKLRVYYSSEPLNDGG